jgi:hypothetical protein
VNAVIPAVAPTVRRPRLASWAIFWPDAAALVGRGLMATLGLSTMGILSVWFSAPGPSAPVPAVASAASALMLVGLLLGSPLVVWVSAHALRRTATDPTRFRPLHRAVRRRTWGFVSIAAVGTTALEVSRAGTHRMPSYLLDTVPILEVLGALSVAMLVSALVFGGPWPWVRRWLGRAALGWGGALAVHGLSRWLSAVPAPAWRWSPAQAHLLDVSVVLSLGSLGIGLLGLWLLRHARPAAVQPSPLTAVLVAPPTGPPPAAPPPRVLPRHPVSGRVRRTLEL